MNISAVIPTRNRPESLRRTLVSLAAQAHPLKEVLIIDAGDRPLDAGALRREFPSLNMIHLTAQPWLCRQRNTGIREASSPYIFLCDDDIELPREYVATLAAYLQAHPQAGAVSGLVVEAGLQGQPAFEFPAPSFGQLLWNFLFQLTVWGDVSRVPAPAGAAWFLKLIRKFYAARGNTFTLAGWPLLSRFDSPAFDAAVYGLGASIIRRDWLLQSPYDEILDPHGIGDNYGAALGFPGKTPVTVLTGTAALHHKSGENRLPPALTYFRRLLALHYFMVKSPRFSRLNRLFLGWSLLGNLLAQLLRGETLLARATLAALKYILSGRNPYLLAWRRKEKGPLSPAPD